MRSETLDLSASSTDRRQATTILRRVGRFLMYYGAYLSIVAVSVFFALRSPVFLMPFNLLNILQQVAVLAVASFGMAAVVMGGGDDVIAGGIDLSIGANIGLTTAVYALLIQAGSPIPVVLALGLLTALVIGLLNSAMVVYLGLLPLLATLAMMYTVNGVELLLTNNVNITARVPFVTAIASNSVLGIPVSVIVLLAMFTLYYLLLHRTPAGIHVQAVGGNRDAAQTSGLPVRFYTILSYLLAGFGAAVSALLVLARLSGSVRGTASLILLDIVLITYVSTTFSRRWVVNIPGVLLGAVLVGILTNGFTLINVPTYWVHGVKGLLILLVVSATSLQKKGRGG